jgi:GNAT superfamily N-acetyltransferase
MTVSLHVREAVAADGDEIGEAHAAAWLAAYDHIFAADFLESAAESRRRGWPSVIRHLLAPPNIVLVGVLAGRVVAFSHATPATAPDMAEINGFYCHPDAWGSGTAAALMTQTEAVLADGCSAVFLWTLRDAARARRFYEKAGFHLTGNERDEQLTDWTTGIAVERPAVEYRTGLRP